MPKKLRFCILFPSWIERTFNDGIVTRGNVASPAQQRLELSAATKTG